MTINYITCMSEYNDNSESYFAKSAKHGVQKSTKGKGAFKVAGRLAQFIDTWKMLTGDTWVLNTIKGYLIPLKGKPLQSQRPLEGVFSKEQTVLLKEEIKSLLEKSTISHCRETSGFFSNIFLVPKKNGASDQSETSEPLGGISSFQDGGYPNIAGPLKTRGLDGEGRSEGCILHHPNSSPSSTTSEVCGRESPVLIHLPPLRSLVCPMDIHESDKAINDTAEVIGSLNNNIY